MAADWTYTPSARPFSFTDHSPRTLVSRLADGGEISRETSTVYLPEYSEEYILADTDADAAQDFYHTKGTHTSFTKLSRQPKDGGATEVTVKFAGPPVFTREGPANWRMVCAFRVVTA